MIDAALIARMDDAVEARETVRVLLRSLSAREERVLRLRFGIGGRGVATLDEAGEDLGVCRERIRQIEAKALRRLKWWSNRGGFTGRVRRAGLRRDAPRRDAEKRRQIEISRTVAAIRDRREAEQQERERARASRWAEHLAWAAREDDINSRVIPYAPGVRLACASYYEGDRLAAGVYQDDGKYYAAPTNGDAEEFGTVGEALSAARRLWPALDESLHFKFDETTR